MAVHVVTDSTCDLPSQVVKDLGITVVPAYVHFGTLSYRDGVDLSTEEFYPRLVSSSKFPTTSAPSAGAFAEVYNRLADETDGIVSIHVSSKLSAVHSSALLGKELVEKDCQIEVIDSTFTSMAMGLLVIAAARASQDGADINQITDLVKGSIPRTHLLAFVETLEYLRRGGRLGKAPWLLGSLLRIRAFITFRDGLIHPAGIARTRAKGIDRLCEFAKGFSYVDELATIYTTTPEEASTLAERLAALFPRSQIHITRMGPALGSHGGPGLLGVAVLAGAVEA
ncbi:DegV family protein [Chloroflexota bacterium]